MKPVPPGQHVKNNEPKIFQHIVNPPQNQQISASGRPVSRILSPQPSFDQRPLSR